MHSHIPTYIYTNGKKCKACGSYDKFERFGKHSLICKCGHEEFIDDD